MLSDINDAIGFTLNGEAIRLVSPVIQVFFSAPTSPSPNTELRLANFGLLFSEAVALELKHLWQWNASLVLS